MPLPEVPQLWSNKKRFRYPVSLWFKDQKDRGKANKIKYERKQCTAGVAVLAERKYPRQVRRKYQIKCQSERRINAERRGCYRAEAAKRVF